MLLRSGRRKSDEVFFYAKQSVKTQSLLKTVKTAPGKPEFSLRETLKCYILTEDSKTVHFDVDDEGHHEISTKDTQSCEDIAWLNMFTRGGSATNDSRNFVILTQRSKHDEFVLLCKGKKQRSLKVLKAPRSEPDYPPVERRNTRKRKHEYPDFKQLNEDNHFFIMHYQGESVQFQCYEDRNYYLYVNDDSLDIRKLENKGSKDDKNFYFRVSYL
ncbi:uncharacterized protein LOC128850485 isoform X2 [Cuculus canorus]|nr:uncharacterized protein LOC128850485 isoform X2 [Cuculus canorus]